MYLGLWCKMSGWQKGRKGRRMREYAGDRASELVGTGRLTASVVVDPQGPTELVPDL